MNDNLKMESSMAAVFSKEYDHNMSIEELKEILNESDEFIILEFKEIEKNKYIREKSKWEVSLKLQYLPMVMETENAKDEYDNSKNNDELNFYIALVEASSLTENLPEIFSVNTVRESDYIEATKCKYAIHISTVFNNFPLTDYQRQLKLLNNIAAETSIFLDISSFTARSGEWLKYTSTFSLPPSLDYLYTIHAIYDDDKNPEKIEYWFHTHGLYRVGCIELEIIGVEDSNAAYGELLSACARLFIQNGVPKSGFIFNPAYKVNVCWLPWDMALKELNIDKDFSGSFKDREDNIHNNPSGALVAVDKNGSYKTLDYFKKELSDNPVFMLSSFETEIMKQAAFEKIEYFINLLNKNKGDDKISFLVKMGYGENNSNKDLEHLWFEVHSFNEDGFFDATLLNEPYKNLGMHEGERGLHNIENLTDWQIYTEEAIFNPKNIYLLFL